MNVATIEEARQLQAHALAQGRILGITPRADGTFDVQDIDELLGEH